MGSPTPAREHNAEKYRAKGLSLLREQRTHLIESLVTLLRQSLLENTGRLSSMRRVPVVAKRIVDEYLLAIDATSYEETIPSLAQYLVQEGLAEAPAIQLLDLLYEYSRDSLKKDCPDCWEALRTDVGRYRLDFLRYYMKSREAYLLREHELTSHSVHKLLEKQMQRERELREILQNREEHLQLVSAISHAAASILDIRQSLDNIVQMIEEHFAFYYVDLFLIDRQETTTGAPRLRPREHEGDLSLVGLEYSFVVGGESLVEQCALTREEKVCTDVSFLSRQPEYIKLTEMRMEIALPLVARGKLIGVLAIYERSSDALLPEEVQTFHVLADQLAVAIQNVWSYQQVEAALNDQEILYRLVQGIAAAETIEEILQNILDGMKFTEFDGIHLQVYTHRDAEGRPLIFDVYTLERGAQDVFVQKDIPITEQFRDWLENVGREVVVYHAQDAEQYTSVQEGLLLHDAQMFLAGTLWRRGKLLGMFTFYRKTVPQEEEMREISRFRVLVETIQDQLSITLESRVIFREMEIRTARLETAAEVSNTISSMLDLDQLLTEVVEVTCARFALYYVGVFLVDDARRWAVLRAGSGEAGKQMLAHGHRLALDDNSMIGRCIVHAEADIRMDVLGTEGHFANPWLPDTRAEMALPLRSRGEIIGAMTVQSEKVGYFTQEDIKILQSVANQVANAIANARFFAEAQQRMEDLQRLQRQQAVETWLEYTELTGSLGYLYDLNQVQPLPEDTPLEVPPEVWQGQIVVREGGSGGDGAALLAPIDLHGEAVGVLSFEAQDTARTWEDEDRALVEEVREQLSLALENRMLYAKSQRALAETQRRAEEVRFLQEIAAFLNTQEDIVNALDDLLLHLQKLLPVQMITLAAYDSRGGQLQAVKASGEVSPSFAKIMDKQAPGDYAFTWIMRHQELWVADDLSQEARFTEDAYLLESGVRSRAALPLMLGSRLLGAWNLGSPEVGAFSKPGVLAILKQVSAQVASAMERANLLQQTRSALSDAEILSQASNALSQANSYDAVLQAIVEHLLLYEPAQAELALYVRDPQTQAEFDWLEIVAAWKGTEEMPGLEVGARIPVADLPILEFGEEQLFFCEDMEQSTLLDDELISFYLQDNVRAVGVAPLLVSGEKLGVFYLRLTQPYHPGEKVRLFRMVLEQAAVVLSNRKLLELSQERAAQLQAAVDMANLTTSIMEREELLVKAVNFFQTQFSLYYVGIFLLDEVGQWAVLQAGTGDAGKKLLQMGQRWQVGSQTMVGWCVAHAQPRIANDVTKDPFFFENPLLPHKHSEIAFPLISRGEVIGALTVSSERLFAFTEGDIATLQLMVNQLANVIESTNLYARSQNTLEETTTLYRIAQRVADARTVEDVLRAAVEGIAQREEPDIVFAGLLEPLGSPTHLHIVEGWDRSGNEISERSFSLDDMPRLYEILSKQQRFTTSDVTQDPMVDEFVRETFRAARVRAVAMFQFEIRGSQYGTIIVQSHKAREFSTSELRFYENVARQAFVALESLNLVETTRAEAEQRAVLNEVLQKASSSRDPQTLVQEVGQVISSRQDMPVIFWKWNGGRMIKPMAVYDAGGRWLGGGEDALEFLLDSVLLVRDTIRKHILSHVQFTEGQECVLPKAGMQFEKPLVEGVAVPLSTRDEVLGALVLARQEGHPPIDEREIDFVRAAGINISVALETAILYQQAQDTAERLKEVDKLKSEFLANMSHELRTPLNSIIGFSRVILKGIDGPLTEMQKTDLNAIYASGKHLLALINDILDISKIEAGKMEFFFEPVDIGELLQDVIMASASLLEDKPQVKLLTDIPDDLPLVHADARRIRQVALNVISNAAKFTEKGFIKVSVTHDDYRVVVSVQDTGIGIPKDKIADVFERFKQVDNTSTRRYEGTGLGMSLSKLFIEKHGGDMWVESEYGKGSTFYFSLPIEGVEEPLSDAEVETKDAQQPEEVHTILTVDDDKGVITLFRRYLEPQGYRVFGLTSGERVVEEAKRLKPYAITLDVLMPGKDGWQVIQELKADPETKDIPILICSIVAEEEKGWSLGIADYLMKPITEQELLNALMKLHQGKEEEMQILVVDDSDDDRKLIGRLLQDAGYHVMDASSGASAIEILHQTPPDLVILDLMMPEVDGFAVLEHLKGNPTLHDIPVIVVTAKELTESEREKLNRGVAFLIQKGAFDQGQLLKDVSAVLHQIGQEVSRS